MAHFVLKFDRFTPLDFQNLTNLGRSVLGTKEYRIFKVAQMCSRDESWIIDDRGITQSFDNLMIQIAFTDCQNTIIQAYVDLL